MRDLVVGVGVPDDSVQPLPHDQRTLGLVLQLLDQVLAVRRVTLDKPPLIGLDDFVKVPPTSVHTTPICLGNHRQATALRERSRL